MAIVHITGTNASLAEVVGTALRSQQINFGKGALLIQENCDGENEPLLEKIIAGAALGDCDLDKWQKSIPFKLDSMIIFVGTQISKLAEFEAMLPGFEKHFGPVQTLTTGG